MLALPVGVWNAASDPEAILIVILILSDLHAVHCSYEPGMKFSPGANAFRHSWNSVNVYNQWYLVDCDWSARYYTSKDLRVENLRYTLNTFYFLTEPSRFIFTHLPDEAKWQLLDTPITYSLHLVE